MRTSVYKYQYYTNFKSLCRRHSIIQTHTKIFANTHHTWHEYEYTSIEMALRLSFFVASGMSTPSFRSNDTKSTTRYLCVCVCMTFQSLMASTRPLEINCLTLFFTFLAQSGYRQPHYWLMILIGSTRPTVLWLLFSSYIGSSKSN